MEKKQTLGMIEAISNAPGVSGFEDEAVAVLRRYGEGLGEFSEDAMRNLYLKRSGHKPGLPQVQLDAHSDEVGFMVKAIRPNGVLDFITLGGWVPSNIPAHRVRVLNQDGQWISGVICSKPPHFLSDAERKAVPDVSDMAIDVGASSDREIREEYRIKVAAPVIPDVQFEYQENRDTMIGKAFDNRLGSAAILATLRELAGTELGVNVTGAFAAQEEVGLRGATVTAQVVRPDIAVSFEGSPADDTVVDAYAVQTALRKGPMLRHIDARMITNPRFQRFALDLAGKKGIPVQDAVRTGGSTNGGIIHLTGKAVPVIVIGIPVRYIHTHYGIASYADFENSVKLGCEVIRALSAEIIAGF
ncbi:peptidase M42 family [Treponema primitia ZAS-2]|uniref:Peptidase M42 family n=1 Tax=Treponema primitia (strain ATCC BAA-887 / DSM 12427 / ZAS-2) TaxID=545694 RepID=F5YJY1_TREPZ|nr:M42 family peptidase [Treponema primitia]AEF85040.1 peptidase M42 family [Treponema primitia ZAS-2]